MARRIKLLFNKSEEAQIRAENYSKGTLYANTKKFLKEILDECTEFQNQSAWYEKNLDENVDLNSNLCD